MNASYTYEREILANMAMKVQAWVAGRTQAPVFQLVDNILVENDQSETATELRKYCRWLELNIVAHDMKLAGKWGYTGRARRRLLNRIVANPDNVELLDAPERAYAFSRCVFTSVNFGLTEEDCALLNTFVHHWLPPTNRHALLSTATANDLADLLFDPNWRAIYAVDFNNLYPEELDALLISQPPLNRAPAPSPTIPAVALPVDIVVG